MTSFIAHHSWIEANGRHQFLVDIQAVNRYSQTMQAAIEQAFRIAFLRALEQWTFDLRRENSNLRYIVSHARNDWNYINRLSLSWQNPS